MGFAPLLRVVVLSALAFAVVTTRPVLVAQAGAVDPTFDIGDGPSLSVVAVALQAPDKIIVAGRFTTFDGTPRFRLARLNADGSLDPGFNPGVGESVIAVAVQPDDRVLVGGNFSFVAGQSVGRLARLTADGAVDPSFNVTFDSGGSVGRIVVLPDGRILIGGFFQSINGQTRRMLARLNADGTLDPSFAPQFNGTVFSVAVAGDGSIIVGGAFSTVNGISRPRLARLTPTGDLDEGFVPVAGAQARGLALQPDGAVIATHRDIDGGTVTSRIVRYSPLDGAIDTSYLGPTFDAAFQPDVYAMQLDGNGRLLVGGNFTTLNGAPHGGLARLNADGTVDTTFDEGKGVAGGSSITGGVYDFAIDDQERVLIGGDFLTVNGESRRHLARLLADAPEPTSVVDPSFDTSGGPNNSVSGLALQGDGRVLITGSFTAVDGVGRNRVARLLPTGQIDLGFNPGTGADAAVNQVDLYDARPVIVGHFTSVNGQRRDRVARLNANGSLDLSFNVGRVHYGLNTVAMQYRGMRRRPMPVIGGIFKTETPLRYSIARLQPDGRVDTAFVAGQTGLYGHVTTIAPMTDGRLMIGGNFTQVEGVPRRGIARLNRDGSLDTTFHPGTGANDMVNDIVLQPDGRVLVSGNFTEINGVPRVRVARLLPDGSVDPTFDTGTGPSGATHYGTTYAWVYAMGLQADGRIVIGGYFTEVAGQPRNRIARLLPDGSLDPDWHPEIDPYGLVRHILMQPDGRILIGGDFKEIDGIPRRKVARLLPSPP